MRSLTGNEIRARDRSRGSFDCAVSRYELAQVRLVVQAVPALVIVRPRSRPCSTSRQDRRAHVAAASITGRSTSSSIASAAASRRLEDRRHRLPERRAATNEARSRHAEMPAQRPEYSDRSIESGRRTAQVVCARAVVTR